MTLDFDPALVAQDGLDSAERDRLAWFSFPSDAHRKVVVYLADGWEVAVRAANQAAKTTTAAAWAVACLQRQTELDGVPLPQMDRLVVGGLLVGSYKQASESSVRAVLNQLGTWPSHVERGSQETVQAIRVKQRDNTDPDWRTWSRLLVLPTDGEFPAGIRLDFAWADEPPKWSFWQELRLRGKANRPFPRVITFTPLDRREWEPIRRDFKGHEEPGRDGKVELRLRLEDNRFLSAKHRRQMALDLANDPYRDARLNGDWIDATGACPLDSAGLNRLADQCRPPKRIDKVDLGDGVWAEVEVWSDPQEGEAFFCINDPSSGAKDEHGKSGAYDPCQLIVGSRTPPFRMVERFNGYLSAYHLGRLASLRAHRANRAMLVWERNSGYGEAFWLGTKDPKTGRHYPNPYIEHHSDVRGLPLAQRLGWTTNTTTRGVIVGAAQKMVLEGSVLIPSLDDVESLRDVTMDHMGRLVAAPGRHDEALIVYGLYAHLLETLPLRYTPKVKTVGEKFNALFSNRRTQGRDETDGLLW